MRIDTTPIAGLYVVETGAYADHRGAFARLFCQRTLAEVLAERQVVQINHSRTTAVGAVRGMHFQYPPFAEMKLVRCLRGRVWDVTIDLRQGSPTFLHWYGCELSDSNRKMLIVPEGMAHGFQVLITDSELLYLHSAYYQPDGEGGVRFDDPRIGVSWPLPIAEVSERDRSHPLLGDDFEGFTV